MHTHLSADIIEQWGICSNCPHHNNIYLQIQTRLTLHDDDGVFGRVDDEDAVHSTSACTHCHIR